MWNVVTLSSLFLLAGARAADSEPKSLFTAISPKIVREFSTYVVQVAVEDSASTPVTFSLSINSSRNENYEGVLYASPPVQIQPGKTGIVELEVKELPGSSYNLTLVGTYGDGKEHADSSLIYKETKTESLLLQTDKVIYKPGETVKYRIVILDRVLRPLSGQTVNITITDPSRNIIKVINGAAVEKGLFSSKIELSTEPNLGDWRIRARLIGSVQSDHTFTVEQYVLPKFKVDVKLPTFLTYNSTKFQAEVRTSYTYGKPLKGKVDLRLSEYARYYYGEQKVVLKSSPIDGSVFIEFDLAAELGLTPLTYDKTFQIIATVTDELTGRQQNGTSQVKVHQYPYKIEMIETPRNYKPGFPLTLKFKVSTQDDIPISDPSPTALKIEHGFACNAQDGVLYSAIPEIGILNITLETPTNEFVSSNSMKVTYKDLIYNAYPPQKSTTPSKAYMVASLNTRTPEPNGVIEVKVVMNVDFSSVNYVLFGRGKILQKNRLSIPTTRETSFEVSVPPAAAPEAVLIVYTVLPTAEIVAESLKFNLASVFENSLNLTLSKETGQPGDKLTISMETAPDSLVALRGVDQSVLLLKEDRDITTKTIEGEIKSFQSQINHNRNWGGSSSFQVFEETGVVILTNAELEKPRVYPIYPIASNYQSVSYDTTRVQESVSFASAPLAGIPGPPGSAPVRKQSVRKPVEIRVRKDFPETWLWEEIQANNSITSVDKVIPDTLTSWYISGYALSPSKGIGVVTKPKVFETFRPFFISLNIPYSVIKGEVFGLQVLVHSYMSAEASVEVTLLNDLNQFEFQEALTTKTIKIGSNEVKSLTFVIKPITFGPIRLELKAVASSGSEQAGDALSRPLLVKPPGQKVTNNQAVLLDLRKTKSAKDTLVASFPPTRVEGADSVKVSVISDLLGSTISNLDKLLKMPTGCGEQNMVYFVPDIVILQYLESSGTLTDKIKSKALRFLESGYQRELTYRHDDGSFSAFGKYDAHGSTWLTAFVVRSFVAAKPYITIDDDVLIRALQFLKSKQQSDGSFVEHGTVLQNELKGGAVESLSLSSYVLLSFLESEQYFDDTRVANISEVKKLGLEYISKSPAGLDNPYAVSLVTYTLQVAGHPKVQAFKDILESLAKREGGLKYWEPKPVVKPVNDTSLRPWVPRTKPVSIEMSSYALLTYLLEGSLDKALPVGKWLLQQRNEQGGFVSTQDTVVGLTALAKFAMTIKSTDSDMNIKARYDAGLQEFKVNKENEIVLQEAILPATVRSLDLEADGKGTALAQLTWSYYVEEKTEQPAFGLDIKTESRETKLQLNLCTWYTHQKDKASNMAVMEVNLPSGYGFDSDGLTELIKLDGVKRYELEEGDTQINIYFDSLSAAKTCLALPANRVFKVANPAKAYAVVFDYYDTTLRAREFYDPPTYSACDICVGEESCAIKNCV